MSNEFGQVILLNGTTSAGKSTLLRQLQQEMDEPYHAIALDQFRDGMPPRFRGLNSNSDEPGARGLNVVPVQLNGELVTEVQFGDYGLKVLSGLRRAVRALAECGVCVVVEDLVFSRDIAEDYARLLHDVRTTVVAVRCSEQVLLAREQQRLGRFPGTAKRYIDDLHRWMDYDVEVYTDTTAPADCAARVVAAVQAPSETPAIQRMYERLVAAGS